MFNPFWLLPTFSHSFDFIFWSFACEKGISCISRSSSIWWDHSTESFGCEWNEKKENEKPHKREKREKTQKIIFFVSQNSVCRRGLVWKRANISQIRSSPVFFWSHIRTQPNVMCTHKTHKSSNRAARRVNDSQKWLNASCFSKFFELNIWTL